MKQAADRRFPGIVGGMGGRHNPPPAPLFPTRCLGRWAAPNFPFRTFNDTQAKATLMASVNKVIILGNLGRDPELRYTPSGSAVCNVSIATTRNWKSREGGERQEETEWHRVVFCVRLAEIAGEY